MLVKVVAAVLMNNDIIFLPRRAETLKSKPGLLEFPGGKVEQGESNNDNASEFTKWLAATVSYMHLIVNLDAICLDNFW